MLKKHKEQQNTNNNVINKSITKIVCQDNFIA